ncbi:hypothetical protein K439DRAFT_1625325 [Ramaria rubella]|nr:hypothetical protein K439DRAFT_1625325 [Ramaria rubella]
MQQAVSHKHVWEMITQDILDNITYQERYHDVACLFIQLTPKWCPQHCLDITNVIKNNIEFHIPHAVKSSLDFNKKMASTVHVYAQALLLHIEAFPDHAGFSSHINPLQSLHIPEVPTSTGSWVLDDAATNCTCLSCSMTSPSLMAISKMDSDTTISSTSTSPPSCTPTIPSVKTKAQVSTYRLPTGLKMEIFIPSNLSHMNATTPKPQIDTGMHRVVYLGPCVLACLDKWNINLSWWPIVKYIEMSGWSTEAQQKQCTPKFRVGVTSSQ